MGGMFKNYVHHILNQILSRRLSKYYGMRDKLGPDLQESAFRDPALAETASGNISYEPGSEPLMKPPRPLVRITHGLIYLKLPEEAGGREVTAAGPSSGCQVRWEFAYSTVLKKSKENCKWTHTLR